MQLFDVVTPHRKPERDGPVGVAEIDCDQRVLGVCIAREQQDSELLIAIPIVEEEVRALTNMVALPPDPQQPADQAHDGSAGLIVEEIPSHRPQQRDAAHSKVGQKVVFGEFLALPEHRNAVAHQQGDQIGLQHVPECPVALGEQRIAGFVGIGGPEIAKEAFVIVVLDVLKCSFGDLVSVDRLPVGVAEEAQLQTQVGQPAAIPMGNRARSAVGAVLPRAVGIGRAQHVLRRFELFGQLHQRQRLACPCVEAAPVRAT